MAAQLAPLRAPSSIQSDSDDDNKNEDDGEEEEDESSQSSSIAPIGHLGNKLSAIATSSTFVGSPISDDIYFDSRDQSNVNAPLESMEGQPLSRQSDDFRNYPVSSVNQNVNSIQMEMNQHSLNGGPIGEINYDSYNRPPQFDYGQPQPSAMYTNENVSIPHNNNNNNDSNNQRTEQSSSQTSHMDEMSVSQQPQIVQVHASNQPQQQQQRPYIPTYPVKTVDPMSQYGQGIRNVAQLPPNISKSAGQIRKTAAQRNQPQKKPESLESLRVDLEVAKKVSQIMSATKQQKLAAENQQKSASMLQTHPKPMINCTNCNKMFTTTRNLQRHRQTCVIGIVGSPSNNSMPPPLTPSQMGTTTSSPSSANFQINSLYPSPSPNQGYLSNGYEYKLNGDGYSDWSRSDSYSAPQSVGPEMEASEQMMIGEQMTLEQQKQETMSDRQKMGYDSNIGIPLSLDVDEQLAPSSSASMSSNSQSATPASYMCESCKKTVSSLRSLRRHHNTCKLYAAEFGIQTDDSSKTSKPKSPSEKKSKPKRSQNTDGVTEKESNKKEGKKKSKSALLEALEAPRTEIIPNIYRAPPPQDVASTSAVTPCSEMVTNDLHPTTPYYGQYYPAYSPYPRPLMGPPPTIQCFPTPSPSFPPSTSSTPHQALPSINSSSWFSPATLTPSTSSESTILSPTIAGDSKEVKKEDADTTQCCDCGENKGECDHGLPRTGNSTINQCEDCNRQLCSASNLKRHRATCKAVMQKLSNSTPTSQPATPAAPRTPLSTSSSTPLPVNGDNLSPSVSKSGSSSSSSCPERKLTSPKPAPKVLSGNYLITSEPAASKPWITVGEHLKAQHVQQQKMQQKVHQHPQVQIMQQYQPVMNPMQNQQSQNKFGIVELKNTDTVQITSQPLGSSEQNTASSFVSTFSDFGSDDELDDIDMDAFDEEMQRGAEMYHLQQEAQLKERAEAERKKNNIVDRRSLEEYTITTVDTSKYAGFKENQQRALSMDSAANPGALNNSYSNKNQNKQMDQVYHQSSSSYHQHPINLPSLNVNTSTPEKPQRISLPSLSLNSSYSMMTPQNEVMYHEEQSQMQYQMVNSDNSMQMQRLPPISLSSHSNLEPFSEAPKKKRQSKSKEKTPIKKEKAESIVTTIDSSSKIEVSDQTSTASPLDSIITSEPLPLDLVGDEKYLNVVVKNPENVPMEISPIVVSKQRKAQEFQCPECLKVYSCRKNVKRHRSAVHKLSADEIAAKPAIALPIQLKEETGSAQLAARRHTMAGSVPTSKEIGIRNATQQEDRKTSHPVVNFVHQNSNNMLQQQQSSIHHESQQHTMQGNSQGHAELIPAQQRQLQSNSVASQSKFQQLPPPPGWNGPPIISSWRRTRSGDFVDDEESKATARIAAELKRSAEEELAEIQGKKPRTELAEADTTFSEDNEKMSHHQLMPMSNAILPSLSSPNHEQMMMQQMQQPSHHIVYHANSTPTFYQPSSGSMGSSLPSIQNWNDYDHNSGYQSQQQHHAQQYSNIPYHNQPLMHHESMYHQQHHVNQGQMMTPSVPIQTAAPCSQSAPQTPAMQTENSLESQDVPIKKKRTYACSGCHKVLSSDYSLRRHRLTCVDVQANRAANEVLKENKKIAKKTGEVGGLKKEEEETASEPANDGSEDGEKKESNLVEEVLTPTDEVKPDEEGGGERIEEVPDSTTSQRHDRSTSPGINGLPTQGSPSNSNSSSAPPLNEPSPKSNGATGGAGVNAAPLPQISLPTTPFQARHMCQSCGKFYSSEWNLERHKRESCPGREKSPPKPPIDSDEIWLIFNGDDSARMKMSKTQLSNSSPYFAQCIKNYEPHKGEMRLVDCDINNFRVLTDVISNSNLINEENVDAVVELSKRYQFTSVFESVERYIGEELPRVSIMHAIRLAEKYRFTIIKQQLFDSISLDVFRSLSSDQHYRMMDSNLKAELLEKWGSFL